MPRGQAAWWSASLLTDRSTREDARLSRRGLIGSAVLVIAALTGLTPSGARAAALSTTAPQNCISIIENEVQPGPNGLAAGPDGRIWITYSGTLPSGVEAVDPATGIGEIIPIPALLRPRGGAIGPDGSYFFVDEAGGADSVWRVSMTGAVTSYALPTDSKPQEVVGANGRVWFTLAGSNAIGSLLPNLTDYREYPIPTPDSLPQGITNGPGTRISFAERLGDRVGQLDTSVPSPVVTEIPLAGGPFSLAADPTGNLWVTLQAAGQVARVDPLGGIRSTTLASSPGFAGIAIAPAPPNGDSGIWFSEPGVNKIGRVDPVTFAVTDTLISVVSQAAQPGAIIALPGGLIWFTEASARKIAHFRVSTTGMVLPLAPQVQLTTTGPALSPSGPYSSQTQFTVTVVNTGACATDVFYRFGTQPGSGTWIDVPGSTATFPLPSNSTTPWYLEYYAVGPGGVQSAPVVTSVTVNDALFPDTSPPALVLPPSPVAATATGPLTPVSYTVTATDANDVSSSLVIRCDRPSGSLFSPGSSTVTCTATDPSGLFSTGSFVVTVRAPAPTISVPAAGSQPATAPLTPVTVSVNAASVVDGPLPVNCTYAGLGYEVSTVPGPGYGSLTIRLPAGTTLVTCSAIDGRGQMVSASFSERVVTPVPAVVVPASVTASATSPVGAVVTYAASGTSIVYGTLPATCIPQSGSQFAIGTTTVSCTVTDPEGQRVGPSTFSVAVTVPPPALALPSPIAVNTFRVQGTYVAYTTTGSSPVYGTLVPTCSPASGALFPVGTTIVTCTVSDGHGRSSSGTFPVTVTKIPCADAVIVLDRTAGAALRIDGGGSLSVTCGGVTVDSAAPDSIALDGHAMLSATWVATSGGIRAKAGAITPAPLTRLAPLADPLAGLTLPTAGSVQPALKFRGGARTIQPGTYAGIDINGSANVTFAPGTYVLNGNGLRINGATAQGDGVLLVNLRNAGRCEDVQIDGGSVVSLRGPAGGLYAGLLLLQDRGCGASLGIEGNAGTDLRGVIYAPSAALRFSGRVGLVLNAAVIVRTVRIDGGTAVTLNTLLP